VSFVTSFGRGVGFVRVIAVLTHVFPMRFYFEPCWINMLLCFHSKANKIHQFLNLILLWNNTLRVSDGPSVHHQESEKLVHLVGFTIEIYYDPRP
jgi:hypothetical protein